LSNNLLRMTLEFIMTQCYVFSSVRYLYHY